MTAPDHDYGPAVERLILAHQGRPLPVLTRLRIRARTSDLARAYRQARMLDRLTALNATKKTEMPT